MWSLPTPTKTSPSPSRSTYSTSPEVFPPRTSTSSAVVTLSAVSGKSTGTVAGEGIPSCRSSSMCARTASRSLPT